MKLITPPAQTTQTRDEGHMRKILSYQVEQYFYSQLAPQLPASIPVAECLSSINQHHADGTSTTAMIMSDLRQQYPVAGEKRGALSPSQVNASLDWLANFHGFWWSRANTLDRSNLVRPPLEELSKDGHRNPSHTIWLNGGYTYLSTRRKEYKSLTQDHDSEWRLPLTQPLAPTNHSIAELAALYLAPGLTSPSPTADYQTLIHGDVKSENLFTTPSGHAVAFYDFQYVGLGLGVCDLAKLFTCSIPLHLLTGPSNPGPELPNTIPMQSGEEQLLRRYWERVKEQGGRNYDWAVFKRHWEVALVDWLRFQASWGFWGETEWLEARVRSILLDEEWVDGLVGEVRAAGLLA